MIEIHRFSRSLSQEQGPFSQEQEISLFSEKDTLLLDRFIQTARSVVGEQNQHKVVLMGGCALRLLEQAVGIQNEGIFSGTDIDMFFCDTDEEIRAKLSRSFQQLDHFPPVDVRRFNKENENKHPLPLVNEVDSQGNMSFRMLYGSISGTITNPIEVIEFPYNKENCIHVFSPAFLYHSYALRAIGGVKEKDWQEKKHKRLLEIQKRLNDPGTNNLTLLSPHAYPELRQARRDARKGIRGLIAQGVVVGTWIDYVLHQRGRKGEWETRTKNR